MLKPNLLKDLVHKRASAAGYLGMGGLERALTGNRSPQPKVSTEHDADGVKTLFFKTVSTSFNKDIRLFGILNECFNKHLKSMMTLTSVFNSTTLNFAPLMHQISEVSLLRLNLS